MAEMKVSPSRLSEAADAAINEMLALPQNESLPNASPRIDRVPPPSQWGNTGSPLLDLGDPWPRSLSPLPPLHECPGPVPMPTVPPLQPRYGVWNGVEIPLPVAPQVDIDPHFHIFPKDSLGNRIMPPDVDPGFVQGIPRGCDATIPLPKLPTDGEYRGPWNGLQPAPVEPVIDGRTAQIAAAGYLRDLATSSPPSSLDWLEPLS